VRVFNFSAGPAALPLEVLEQARAELTDWAGTGMSVMEVSHRGTAFTALAQRAEARLRALLAVPAGYRVLFLQGGASTQFAAVPLNLAAQGARADYLKTGLWSSKALEEAGRLTVQVNIAADEADEGQHRTDAADNILGEIAEPSLLFIAEKGQQKQQPKEHA
jgi:phosphoserine aminotransferase